RVERRGLRQGPRAKRESGQCGKRQPGASKGRQALAGSVDTDSWNLHGSGAESSKPSPGPRMGRKLQPEVGPRVITYLRTIKQRSSGSAGVERPVFIDYFAFGTPL